MLVVIVVLGIVTGLGVALVAPGERDVQARESRRFAGALEYAAARAQWRNERLGVSANHGAVRYWRRDDANERWLPLEGDDVLATQVLAAPLDAAPVAYAGRAVARDAVVPLRASGRNEPLAFTFATQHFRTFVALDPLNRVAITGPLAIEP
jgi:hypothetical protein